MFENLRKSKKGLPVESVVRQLIAFMSDGSNTAVSYFNHLKKDEGYAAVLESKEKDLLSSHSVNRFFQCFTSLKKSNTLRKVLIAEFIRQLKAFSPDRVVLDIDTMVLDNSESDHRHGVKPTYKKGIKGFQNLQIAWGGILVDAVWRHAEFFDKRESWKLCDEFRVVHTQLMTEDNGQTVLDFIRQDSLIYPKFRS